MKNREENIAIEEQDLFCYIFFPGSISAEKKELIESDQKFDEKIEFYSNLKINSENRPDADIKRKLANKISAYNLPNVIKLYALEEPDIPKQNENRLAADSKKLKPKMTTKTFVDNDKEYLIKVLSYSDSTKIFVFTKKDEKVKNFDIIIEPHNLIFHFEDNTEPLTIDKYIEADTITLKFE